MSEQLAQRAAGRYRQAALTLARTVFDTGEYRRAGGTDEGLEMLAELRMRAEPSRLGVVRAVAQELGIALVAPNVREQLDDVAAAQRPVIERVLELVGPRRADADDERLAAQLAERASASMRGAFEAAGEHWIVCLAQLAAAEFGVPQRHSWPFREHSAVLAAMRLLGIDPSDEPRPVLPMSAPVRLSCELAEPRGARPSRRMRGRAGLAAA
jgi:hypothetical protein